ncbi:MAG: DUF1573 domain-containing protein [Thermoanaerobaculia bacterium]
MRHFTRMGGLALALAALSTAPSFAADAAAKKTADAKPVTVSTPKISIDPMMKDAGTVAKGDRIDAIFTVKNSGTQDLVISDARPSCGCTVASFDKVIKPGQSGKITAAVDTKNFNGPITKAVTVVSNDPENPQIALTIKAVVKPYVEVAPQEFVRFSTIRGDSAAADLVIFSSEKDFHPTVADSSQPYLQAEISPIDEKSKLERPGTQQYRLHITLGPTAPLGVLNAPVRIKTGVAKQPELEIRVAGIVRDRLSVTPAAVAFGNFTPGKDVISRNVIFTNNKPTAGVRVLKAESTVPGLSVEVVPMTEGINYTIVVKPKEGLKKGEFTGSIKIFTSDKDRAVIEVPVSGNVL